MLFSSIKEINRLISKGIYKRNRLISKGIYKRFTIEKNWRSQNFDFLGEKN